MAQPDVLHAKELNDNQTRSTAVVFSYKVQTVTVAWQLMVKQVVMPLCACTTLACYTVLQDENCSKPATLPHRS